MSPIVNVKNMVTLACELDCRRESLPSQYLVMLVGTQFTSQSCGIQLTLFMKRLASWKIKYLREATLLKSPPSSLPIYLLLDFVMPSKLGIRLEGFHRDFPLESS